MTARLAPDAAAVARFRDDLAALCDLAMDRVLVAVSGGADSVALLLLTHTVVGDRCVAATVDHGLRREAAGEAAWVARLCAEHGIAHATLAAPMPERAGRTLNVSARARALRYQLLDEEAGRVGARWIATGHHADDQLETLVMRLNRGAGVSGLAGVRAAGARTIRPLLGWRRASLARVVVECGIVAVEDPSNTDDRYDRARLRKVLAGAAWLDAEQWGRSAAALGEAEAALDWMTERLAAEHCLFEVPGEAWFWPEDVPAELRRRLLDRCVRHVQPGHEVRGSTLARAVDALGQGATITLGDVLCEVLADEQDRTVWSFVAAPPRRGDDRSR